VDAHNAFVRLQEVFEAESLPDEQTKNFEFDNALEVDGASFTWDAPPPEPEGAKGKGKGKDKNKKAKDPKKDKKGKKKSETDADATVTPASGSVPDSSRASTSHEPEKVFKIPKTNMTIPKGQIVAIVGSGRFGQILVPSGFDWGDEEGDRFGQVRWIAFLLSPERVDPGMSPYTLQYYATPY
jgi:ABC-type multidrug transport system fused ATPase/permease subunit